MRIIIDIKSNRIVWYTEGDDKLTCSEGTALVDYNGDWPNEITKKNCWNWLLRDRKVVLFEPPAKQTLYQTNKTQTERLIRIKINEKRKRITSDMVFEETLNTRKIHEAHNYLNNGTDSWLVSQLAKVWGIEDKEAAQRIMDEWTSKERMLQITEIQLCDYLNRLNATTTSEEVLAMHEEITKI